MRACATGSRSPGSGFPRRWWSTPSAGALRSSPSGASSTSVTWRTTRPTGSPPARSRPKRASSSKPAAWASTRSRRTRPVTTGFVSSWARSPSTTRRTSSSDGNSSTFGRWAGERRGRKRSRPSTVSNDDKVKAAGKRRWFVPDAYLPAESSHGLESHEAACFLNVSDEDAAATFTFYFEDREPIADVILSLGARRTRHVRLDRADELGAELPRGTPFAYAVESDVPIVLQHSRLDTTAGGYTLITTIAYSAS